MSSVIKDLYLHKKMVESSRGLNSVRRFYEQLLKGMSSVIKDLYLHKKMVGSSRGLNSVGRFYEQLLLVLSCSAGFRGISDNPNPELKRLTISFLALEGKGSYSFPLH